MAVFLVLAVALGGCMAAGQAALPSRSPSAAPALPAAAPVTATTALSPALSAAPISSSAPISPGGARAALPLIAQSAAVSTPLTITAPVGLPLAQPPGGDVMKPLTEPVALPDNAGAGSGWSAPPPQASATPTRVPPAPTRAPTLTPRPTLTPTITPTYTPLPPDEVSAFGDSVMLGAVNALRAAIVHVDIDAAVSRQTDTAIQIIAARRAAGTLGSTVVVHMGTNGTFTAEQFDRLMRTLAGVPRVVFINIKVARAWEGPNNTMLSEGVKRYPNAVLVDWHDAGANHPEYFWDDGFHLRPEGQRAYAELVAAAARAQ